MSDRLCRYCEDEGCSECSRWCYAAHRLVFIRCEHVECWERNGRHGFPPGPVQATTDGETA